MKTALIHFSARLRKTSLLFLLLLPPFFLLHNYNELFGFIPLRQVLLYGIAIYAAEWIGYFVCNLFLHSRSKSALVLFIFSLIFLVFGPLHHFFRQISFNSFIGTYRFFLPFIFLIHFTTNRQDSQIKICQHQYHPISESGYDQFDLTGTCHGNKQHNSNEKK